MSTEAENGTPRRRIWLRILLGASLALNLLVVGLAIGAALRFGGPDGARRPPPSMGATLYREMSRADRKAFRAAMHDAPRDRQENRRAEAKRLGAVLRATPFDAGAVLAVLADQAQHRAQWQSAVNEAWLARVAAMTDAERAAYATRLETALTRTHHHGRDRESRDD